MVRGLYSLPGQSVDSFAHSPCSYWNWKRITQIAESMLRSEEPNLIPSEGTARWIEIAQGEKEAIETVEQLPLCEAQLPKSSCSGCMRSTTRMIRPCMSSRQQDGLNYSQNGTVLQKVCVQ